MTVVGYSHDLDHFKGRPVNSRHRPHLYSPRLASLASLCSFRNNSWYFTFGGTVITWAYPCPTSQAFTKGASSK